MAKRKKSPITIEDVLAVSTAGGVFIPLEIGGVIVGSIRWDADAAFTAILDVLRRGDPGQEYQAALQQFFGGDTDRMQAAMVGAFWTANLIGAQLRLSGAATASAATVATDLARASYRQCPGCHRYFLPAQHRPRDDPRGRKAHYHNAECQRVNHPRKKRTPAELAAAKQYRQVRRDAKLLGFNTPDELHAMTPADKKAFAAQLQRADPRGYKAYCRVMGMAAQVRAK